MEVYYSAVRFGTVVAIEGRTQGVCEITKNQRPFCRMLDAYGYIINDFNACSF